MSCALLRSEYFHYFITFRFMSSLMLPNGAAICMYKCFYLETVSTVMTKDHSNKIALTERFLSSQLWIPFSNVKLTNNNNNNYNARMKERIKQE